MACPQGLVAFQYGAREIFCGGMGRGGECLVEVKEFRFISTEKVCLAHFYSGGTLLRRKHISTAEVHFYSGDTFLQRRCISMKEVNLKAIGVSLVWKSGTITRRR